MSKNLPGLALGMLQNAGEGHGLPPSSLNSYLWGRIWPRTDGLCEGGVMEAGWRHETHPGMGGSLP